LLHPQGIFCYFLNEKIIHHLGNNPRQSIICAVNPDADTWIKPLFPTRKSPRQNQENEKREKAAIHGVNAYDYLQELREAIVNYN